MKPFLICGLPRSRTFWLRKYFSTDQSICAHDPIVFFDTKEDIKDFYESISIHGFEYVGISDSAAGFWIDYILEEIKPKVLIVERDIRDVEKSLQNLGLNLETTPYCETLKKCYDKVDNNELVMRVDFDWLNDPKIMKEICEHLTPGIPFDEEYFNLMNHRNLQVDVHGHLNHVLKNKGQLVKEILQLLQSS